MLTNAETHSYDAFGDKTPVLRTIPRNTLERRAHSLGIAIFWSLALLIVAGRVYYAPIMPTSIELASR